MVSKDMVEVEWSTTKALDVNGIIAVMVEFTGLEEPYVRHMVQVIFAGLYKAAEQGMGFRIPTIGVLTYRVDDDGKIVGRIIRSTGKYTMTDMHNRGKLVNLMVEDTDYTQDTLLELWRAFCESIRLIMQTGNGVFLLGIGCLTPVYVMGKVIGHEWELSPLSASAVLARQIQLGKIVL